MVYQVGINKGIILRCTAYQISKVASCWLFLLSHTAMHGSINVKDMTLNFKQKGGKKCSNRNTN